MSARLRTEVSLSVAAHRLGLSWQQAWRLLLRGELQGRKSGGRWAVDEESLERLRRLRTRTHRGATT